MQRTHEDLLAAIKAADRNKKIHALRAIFTVRAGDLPDEVLDSLLHDAGHDQEIGIDAVVGALTEQA